MLAGEEHVVAFAGPRSRARPPADLLARLADRGAVPPNDGHQRSPLLPPVVGAGTTVPLVGGADVEYANLDYAASAPCLTAVKEVVDRLLPQYASVHRGTGHLSRVCTVAYEEARRSVRRFVGARARSAVIFTRNTTDAMNLLAHVAPRGTTVITFDTEHHATLLAWRGLRVVHLAPPRSAEAACAAVDEALRRAPVGPRLLAVTGASNVTGEVWPLRALARIAHSRGARIAVDAAQLAPHARIDAAADDLDYVALSAHKLYAPFGAGALVGRADWLQAAPPYLIGGGATVAVTADRVRWADVPDRHEAGSPNVVGAVALAAACDAIAATDRAAVEAREARLLARLRAGLAAIDGVDRLSLWGPDAAAIGLVSFVADGIDGQKLAAILSAEHGIGVRAGGFCAHRFVRHLVGATRPRSSVAEVVPVRASIGLGTTQEHVDRLVAAVRSVLRNGPRWTYAVHDGEWVPAPDPRPVELPW